MSGASCVAETGTQALNGTTSSEGRTDDSPKRTASKSYCVPTATGSVRDLLTKTHQLCIICILWAGRHT